MKKNKKILLSVLLCSTLFSTNSFAYFDASAVLKKGFDYMSDSFQDGMKNWAATTANNGMSAASESLKSCLSEIDIQSKLSEMGGAAIELPCGEVWSVDNPIDDIINSISTDMVSSLNKFANDTIDNITDISNLTGLYCKKDVEFVPDFANYFNSVSSEDKKDLMTSVKEELGLICPQKEEDSGKITSNSAYGAEKNKIKGINKEVIGKSGNSERVITKELLDREEKYLKDKIEFLKDDNLKLALSNPMDPRNQYLLLNLGDTLEDTLSKKMILENCDVIPDPKLKQQCYSENTTVTDNDRKAFLDKFNNDLRLPIPIFYAEKRPKTVPEPVLFTGDWTNYIPKFTVLYLSPYEISEYFLVEDENGVSVTKFDKIYKSMEKTNFTKEDDITLGELVKGDYKMKKPNPPKDPISKWNSYVFNTLFTKTDKTGNDVHILKRFDEKTLMDLLIRATNLYKQQIASPQSQTGSYYMGIIDRQLKLYTDIYSNISLQKQLKILEVNLSQSNTLSVRQKEEENKVVGEQLLIMNKMLIEMKELGVEK